ncbi:MAG: hypothetical protein RIS63_361 [Bacteroidota bacterium]
MLGHLAMTTERRQAPRKKIKLVEKAGSWGKLQYVHHLVCGHTETRKRLAPSSEIACVQCFREEQTKEEMRALSRVSPLVYGDDNSFIDEELKIERTRAALASKFGVPLDAIDVASEYLSSKLIIRSATIYLSALDVDKLTKNN